MVFLPYAVRTCFMEVENLDELAEKVVPKLHERGPVIGDHVILSRRQALALASGAAGVGLLSAIGVENASAEESVGQLGSEDEPLDLYAALLEVNGYELFIQDSEPSDPSQGDCWIDNSEAFE